MSDESPIIVEVVDKVAPSIKVNLLEIGANADKANASIDKLKNALNQLTKNDPVANLKSQLQSLDSSLQRNITTQNALAASNLKAETASQKLAQAQNATAISAQKLAAEQARTEKAVADAAAASDRAAAASLRLQRAQEAAQTASARATRATTDNARAMDANGISARDMSNRLRTIPMQMTDIVVSLQGGQAPLTVLLQQGGQLKDVFGGALPALKAFGGYLISLITPFTVLAAAAAALFVAFYQGGQELRDFQNAAVMSGNAIGLTSEKFNTMTDSISAIVGTKGKAAEALTEIAKAGNLTGTEIERIATTAVLMEKATGQSLEKTVEAFSNLAKEPVKASLKLNETFQYLTESVYSQIKALEEHGDKLAAAELAEKSYADAMTNRAKTVVENVGYMERGWNRLLSVIKNVWDWMKNIGRENSIGEQLGKLQKELSIREESQSKFGNMGGFFSDGKIDKLKNEINLLQEQQRLEKRGAERQAQANTEREETLQSAVRWDKLTEQTENNKAKRLKLIEQIRKDGLRLGKSELEIQTAINDIEAKYKDPKGPRAKHPKLDENEKLIASIRQVEAALNEEAAQQEKLTPVEKFAAKLNAEIASSKFKYSQQTLALKDSLIQEMLVTEKSNMLREASNKAIEQNNKNREIDLDKKAKEIDQINEQISKQTDHNNSLRLTKEATAELSVERERANLLTEESIAIKKLDRDLDEYDYEQTMKLINAKRQLLNLKAEGGMLETAAKEAKEATQEWDKFSKSLYTGIVDNLERAFKKGSGFFNSLWQGIKDAFRNTTLKLLVQAGVSTTANALGLSGIANAANLGSSGSNLISSASSLFSGGGIGSTAAGLLGSGVSSLFGVTAGNAALGGALGLGAGSASAAAIAAAEAGGAALTGSAVSLAGTMGSLGSGLASLAGPIGLAIAGASLLSGMFGKEDSRFGGGYQISKGQSTAQYTGGPVKGFQGDANVASAISTTSDGINALLKDLGSSLSLQTYYGASETSNKGRGGVMAGGILSNGRLFGEDTAGSNYRGDYYENTSTQSPDSATAAANLALDLKQSVIQALQAAFESNPNEIPRIISEQLSGVNAEGLSDEAVTKLLANIDAANSFNKALNSMPFDKLKNLGYAAAQSLVAASGGMEGFISNLSSYFDKFYTDEEKRSNTVKNITNTLNKAGGQFTEEMITSMDRIDFRRLVESTDENSPLFAALISINAAFADITETVDKADDSLVKIMDDLKKRTNELRIEGLRLRGDTTGANALQRAIDTEGFDDAALALYDYNRALEEQISVTQKAKDDLIAAYQNEADAMQSTVDKFTDFSKSLRGFRDSLLVGDKSPLTPMQQYAVAQSQFDEVFRNTKSNDPTIKEDALGKLQNAASNLLDISAVVNASGTGFTNDFNKIQGALTQAADYAAATADVSKLQLDAANRQIEILTGISNAIVSEGQRRATYETALVDLGYIMSSQPEITAQNAMAARTAAIVGNQATGANSEYAKSMQELVKEIILLRKQSEANTNNIVQSNYDANQKNADQIAEEQAKAFWLAQKTTFN